LQAEQHEDVQPVHEKPIESAATSVDWNREFHRRDSVAAGAAAAPAKGTQTIRDVVEEDDELVPAPEASDRAAWLRRGRSWNLKKRRLKLKLCSTPKARGNGTVEARVATAASTQRVEVRAPAGTAGYTQRAPRPGFDRRRGLRADAGRGWAPLPPPRIAEVPKISDLLKEGQEILVQIAKEPIGKKGARITSHIALPGRFLVYMPTVNHTGVSRKIASEEERQRLKRIIISERENGHGGFIVRTAAQSAAKKNCAPTFVS
jgi:Rne/Rng family ribonuclease